MQLLIELIAFGWIGLTILFWICLTPVLLWKWYIHIFPKMPEDYIAPTQLEIDSAKLEKQQRYNPWLETSETNFKGDGE